jgi:hypothetical protein
MVIAPSPAISDKVAVEMTTCPEASASPAVLSEILCAYSERVPGLGVGVGEGASAVWPDTGNAALPIRRTMQETYCELEIFMPEILPAWAG